jgi:thiol-disulfide isomerase/thioredoxin
MAINKKVRLILPLIILLAMGAYLYNKYLVAPKLKLSDITISTFLEEQSRLDQLAAVKNKVIVLNVWATWCPPCVAEMPMFDNLFIEYEGRPVEFLLVSDEEIYKLKKFTSANALTVPIYHLPYRMQDIGVHSIPATFIFDKKGKLVHTKMGAFESAEELTKLIDPLL